MELSVCFQVIGGGARRVTQTNPIGHLLRGVDKATVTPPVLPGATMSGRWAFGDWPLIPKVARTVCVQAPPDVEGGASSKSVPAPAIPPPPGVAPYSTPLLPKTTPEFGYCPSDPMKSCSTVAGQGVDGAGVSSNTVPSPEVPPRCVVP